MLRSTTIFLSALAFAAPAIAEKPAVRSSFEGQQFEYVTSAGKRGSVQIDGKFLKDGEPFTLTVKPSGQVEGFFGQTPVSFKISRKKHGAMARSLATAEAKSASAGAAFSAGTN